ncbi:unnamed protein product [Peronospora belbahrii]|uniref:Uncharacterized protein n=1 Tax=Peronospora belbahrii TaxID=622444 RepID=A0ABN8CYY6_9STRA|nr:unnamed protein product [Peronospora belbahrii]
MYHNARNDLPTVSLRDIQSLYTTMSYTLKYDGTMTGTVGYTLGGSSYGGGISIGVKVVLAQLADMQPVPNLNKVLANSVTIGGVKFTLFYVEDRNKVSYTFVANQMTMSFQGNLMEFYKTIFSLSAKEKNYWSAYSLNSTDYLSNVMFGIDVVDATNGVMTVPTYSTIRTLVNAK